MIVKVLIFLKYGNMFIKNLLSLPKVKADTRCNVEMTNRKSAEVQHGYINISRIKLLVMCLQDGLVSPRYTSTTKIWSRHKSISCMYIYFVDILLFRTFKPSSSSYISLMLSCMSINKGLKSNVSFMHFNTMIDKVKTIWTLNKECFQLLF